jgi:hypothetical protein
MNNDLYFIPILSDALTEPDRDRALERAFLVIERQREVPGHERGYAQFVRFMDAVARLAAEPAGGEADGIPDASPAMGVVMEKDGTLIEELSFHILPAVTRITKATSGLYRLRLSTGRLLWEGRLGEAELLWSRAFPGEGLQLAADTGSGEHRVSLRLELLRGEVVMRVLPGLETGTIEICIDRGKDVCHDA